MQTFHDFDVMMIDGTHKSLADFGGKVVLAVNVASECGLTPQYAGLEKIYREHQGRDFVVLGFPCNQFGSQEPGSEEAIRAFCTSRYDVTFPLTSKIEVNGSDRHPVYAWLTHEANGFPGDITWNFEKFLIGPRGRLLRRYSPKVSPEDKTLLGDIVSAVS